ncbi:MAG: histidine biosynthesis protein [Lachnospiraceae bacterium]|nr:histidine biosynthesis protein [Lachnospiraceae bacterium]
MYTNDMNRRRMFAMEKVHKAIEKGNGHTILSTGITGDDARMAKAAVDAGITMLEPNHPAVVLARGYKGITTMDEAEQIRHEITVDQMAEVTHGVRSVVGKDIYITVGIPGGFTEVVPTPLLDEHFIQMARAGADGLHTHKSSLHDLEELVNKAHKYGLCVDAYIGLPTDKHTFGISAETPEEVRKVAKQMEDIGTDMIGMMTGMSYEGIAAGQIPEFLKERVCAMVEAVKVPTLAEGGINMDNFKAFKDTGVNILVIGTAIDGMAGKAIGKACADFLKM